MSPHADYARTQALGRKATGVDEEYDPDEGNRRIQALLDGGRSVDEAARVALLTNRGLQVAFLEMVR